MRWCLFYHSLVSDWNHGNAHFLRGVLAELLARGHEVRVYEPANGWSRQQLLRERGDIALSAFAQAFPGLESTTYDVRAVDVGQLIDGADVVVAHEWTDRGVLQGLAECRARGGRFSLLFHDTHHRAVSAPDELTDLSLERFDGILAFGESLAERYRQLGWGRRAWVWHEAADTRVFYPRETANDAGDLIWVGNWGDNERVRELDEYLLAPVAALRLRACVHGVRFPADARERLAAAGIDYGGWVPNHEVPDVFSRFRVTVHIPRAPYVTLLPGIPTIRPFEALACGIPLVSAPWRDVEHLFRSEDYLRVSSGADMTRALDRVLRDADLASALAAAGLETIRARHTCAHRVDELVEVVRELQDRH